MSHVQGDQSTPVNDHIEPMTVRTWLDQAPFTLTLSSGFFGFFAHCGVLSALIEEGLVPSSVTGSSAGALVGGVWASGRSLPDFTDALFDVQPEDFWDPALGLGLLKGKLFEQKLRELLACQMFNDTIVPLRVTAFHCGLVRARVFSQGDLALAIRASCTFPGLLQPVWIEGTPYIDGGVSDRPGWSGLGPSFRVFYHHLVSRSRFRSALGLTRIPQRRNTVGLVLDRLPRCSPRDLSSGPTAFAVARDATLYALDQELSQPPEEALTSLRLNALECRNAV